MGAQPGRDLAELRTRPGRDHNATTSTGLYDRAHECCPGQVAEPGAFRDGRGVLVYR